MKTHLEFIDFEKFHEFDDLTDNDVVIALRNVEGIEEIKFTKDGIGMQFNKYIIGKSDIVKVMEELGYLKKTTNKKSGLLGSFIEKIAESNTKNFGDQKLDCCDLNKQ